jgi:hypothetical protein
LFEIFKKIAFLTHTSSSVKTSSSLKTVNSLQFFQCKLSDRLFDVSELTGTGGSIILSFVHPSPPPKKKLGFDGSLIPKCGENGNRRLFKNSSRNRTTLVPVPDV